ncbi:OmpA family protein [Labilibaculum sp.]|uniref:OmpA family protein n=1 Tax=Labilibaculum sp. TaxID=2060723 RepID=UPI003563A1B6
MNRSQISYFLLVIALLLSGITSSLAQNQQIQKADRLYDNKEFAAAINYYQKHLENSDDIAIKRKLAHCYLQTQKDSEANYLLENIVSNPKANANDYLEYANLLKRFRNYDKAKIFFKKYATLQPDDKNVEQLILSCNLINELQDNQLYLLKSLSINSPQSDFASAFYKDGLIFVSGRKNSSSKQVDGRSGEYFLDLYFSKKSGDHFLQPETFSDDFNTKYHEGPACLSSNEKFIFFTRNKGNLNLQGKSELNLYTARYNGSDWDKAELFQFSGQNYSIGHPTISADGRLLYFISNMDGGYGGTDIYVCQKLGFTWSRPINCGPAINSEGNEMFPFIAEDGYLYFASDGHIGFGGLDIFKSIFDQNEWTYPVNLGPPFNSSKDDFGYIVKKNKNIGYFSSNRNGSDDMFEFQQNPEKIQSLNGRLLAKDTKKPVKDVEITLMENLSKEKTTLSNEDGLFSFDIFKGKNYSLIVSKAGYKTKRILYFSQANEMSPKQLNISLDTTQWVQLNGNIIDQFSARSIKECNIQIINQTYKSELFCLSDNYGDFSQEIDPSTQYNIIIQKEGYFTKVIPNFKYQPNKFEQIELQKLSPNQNMELYGVEYASNSWELTQKTIAELDNLAGLLKVNPHILVEIHGYTTLNKGKKENKVLCEKRAEVASEYVISKGITPNRVQFKSGGFNSGRSALVIRLTEAF